MKVKVTSKQLKSEYPANKIICLSYCCLQNIISASCIQPFGYNSGVYGWNYDCYAIDDCLIITGYRPFGKRPKWQLINDFQKKSENIYSLDYEELKETANELLSRFCELATKNNK